MVLEDRLPEHERLVQGAPVPGGECRHVKALARGRLLLRAPGRGEALLDRTQAALIEGRHREIGLETMAHEEAGIGREHLVRPAGGVPLVLDVVRHRRIEVARGLGTFGRQRQPPLVADHVPLLPSFALRYSHVSRTLAEPPWVLRDAPLSGRSSG